MTYKSHRYYFSIALVTIVFITLLLGTSLTVFTQAVLVGSLCLFLWATGWVPHWLSAVIFFTFSTFFNIAPSNVVFAGFTSSATWMIFSGLVIGSAIQFTGLGACIAGLISPYLQGSFNRAFIGSALFGLLLAFFMPAALGRVLLIIPLLISISEHLGYEEGSSSREGFILSGIMGTFLPTFAILPANVPNNVLMGAAESVVGYSPTYTEYLALHFPTLGILKLLFLLSVIKYFYSKNPAQKYIKPIKSALTFSQKTLVLLLLIAVSLWLTDKFHGISPAWVGMAIALICLMPNTNLMEKDPIKNISFEPLLYAAGVISLGSLAFYVDIGGLFMRDLASDSFLMHTTDLVTFMLLSFASFIAGVFLTLPGVPALMMPFVPELAVTTGWKPEAVYMTQVLGFSTIIFPYQSPALILGAVAAGISLRMMTKICLITAFFSLVALWPLSFLWWKFLGWI